jgi:DNA-binding Lrp family transcriptional regulator
MIKMNVELDATDKIIIFELERNARLSDVALGKIVKKSKDAVRYRIKRLESEKVIRGYKTWIDAAKFGYKTNTLYFTLLSLPERRKKMFETIINDKRTYWVGIAEGAWNIAVSYFIQSNEEFFEMKSQLLSEFSDIIIETKMTSLVEVSVHEKIFLTKGRSELLTFTESVEKNELDALSKKILVTLYANSRANIADIAADNKTTVDKVRTRMRMLEEKRIIIRYTLDLDYNKIGYEFYKAFIYLKGYAPAQLKRLMEYAEQSRTIINIVKQLAPWDYEFVIFARNFQEYQETLSELTAAFPDLIKNIETAVMSTDIIFPCKKLVFEKD